MLDQESIIFGNIYNILDLDECHLLDTIPKYFKNILVSPDEVVILGGYDYKISNSSKKVSGNANQY